MSTRVGIVWNPSKVERETLEAAFDEILGATPAAGASGAEGTSVDQFSWFETDAEDQGSAAAQRAVDSGADLVLAVGGDGTVRAVAECLAKTGSGAEMGVIPLGTGNLLARNLGIPLNNIPAAVKRALTGPSQPLDVGWAEIELPEGAQRHAFVVMAGFGIDAHMITETDDDLKDRAGWLAYVESLGRAVNASEVIDIGLAVDGAPLQREQAHTLIVGNCGAIQGGLTLLPDADPSDGELDVLVLHADGLAGWLGTMRNMVWDNGLKRLLRRPGQDEPLAESSDATTHRRFTMLHVELDEPRVFEVDGDDLGATDRILIEVQQAALRIR